jgi:murein DD-endopeptidase MepM/ murein hydrolase activator NlpD
MAKNSYFYYDHEACTFVEVTPDPLKAVARVGLWLGLAVILAAAGTWMLYETTTTPQELALKEENRVLQNQLAASSQRFGTLENRLSTLADTDRDLYRTIFQADPISEDVRRVGVGGAAEERFDRFSPSTTRLLRENEAALEQLDRQVNLQRNSYEELLALARQRAEAIPQMPAILPIQGTLTSGFGMRRHPILRVYRAHNGVDFAVPVGTPVYATGDGIIEQAGMNSGYGLTIRIRHPKAERVTLYAHLSRAAEGIRQGVRVQRGQLIAYSGNTGLSTAPHLHYEIHDLNGEPINPVYSFAPGVRPSQYLEMLRIAESDASPLD